MSQNLIVFGRSRICLGTSTGQKPSCMNNCEGDFAFTPFQAVSSGTKSEVYACSKGRAQPAGLPLQNRETSLAGLFGAEGKTLGFASGCKAEVSKLTQSSGQLKIFQAEGRKGNWNLF